MRNLALIVIWILAGAFCYPATQVATSTSYADVNTAYSAASDGDTISIPSGSSTWTSTLTVTKYVHFEGAGVGVTILTNNVGSESPLFDVNAGSSSGVVEFSGIKIVGVSQGSGYGIKIQEAADPLSTKLIVHDCTFLELGSGIYNGDGKGVVYDSIFDDCDFVIRNRGNNPTTTVANYGDEIDASSDELFVIEDCTINMDSRSVLLADGLECLGYVIRHCTINIDGWTEYPFADVHGDNVGDGDFDLVKVTMIYENTINVTGTVNTNWFLDARGGQIIVYNNTITRDASQGFNGVVRFREEAYGASSGQPKPLPAINVIHDSYVWNNLMDTVDQAPVVDGTANNTNAPGVSAQDVIVENSEYFRTDPRLSITILSYPHPWRSTSSNATISNDLTVTGTLRFGN